MSEPARGSLREVLLQEFCDCCVDMDNRYEFIKADGQEHEKLRNARLVATERVLQIHRNHFGVEARDVKREVQWQFSGAATSVFLAEQLLVNFGSAEHRVVQEELRAMLVATLDAMEPLDREVITMRFFEELTNGEVAEALGITKNGASSRFVRAMTRLKKDLSNIPGFFD